MAVSTLEAPNHIRSVLLITAAPGCGSFPIPRDSQSSQRSTEKCTWGHRACAALVPGTRSRSGFEFRRNRRIQTELL